MAMCQPRSWVCAAWNETIKDTMNAKAYGGAVRSLDACESLAILCV